MDVTELPAKPVRVGPEGEPELTLGWVALEWMIRNLYQPDGPDAGGPFRPTQEQARFIRWWYAIDAEGRFTFRRGTLRRMKGWGKDPIAAALAAFELCGPCRVREVTEDGRIVPTTHPAPWIQVAAVSKDQTRNTMTLFPRMFGDRGKAAFGLDIGKEIIYNAQGGRIEAVTSSPRALEGGRPTLVIKNENHHWLGNNDGLEMSKAIARNLAKSRDGSSRALSITNAHQPGEDSDAEHEWEAWQKISSGQSKATGVYYDSLEAPPDTVLADRENLRAGLLAARGDSDWLDVDRLIEEIYDPATPPSMSRRFYLNQVVAAEDAWIAPHQWDELADDTLTLASDELVTLGFDGSKSNDHTALMACRISDGAMKTLGVWNPEEYDGEVPRDLVDEAVMTARQKYDVVGFFSDLHPFESYVDKWAEDFASDPKRPLCVKATAQHPIAWDMRARGREFTLQGVERMYDEIVEKAFRHDGDPRVRQHFHNARRRENPWGVGVGKETRSSSRKIDSVPAAILARMARRAYLALPKSRQRRQRTGKANFF